MTFGDHAVLWLHIATAVFTIGPGTAAIMSTPRYIKKRNSVVVRYLFRTTRIYSFATLLTLIFGLVLTGMMHKFSQWWISVSLTLFVVAFVLLLIILRDQRRALTALNAAAGAVGPDAVENNPRSEAGAEAAGGAAGEAAGGTAAEDAAAHAARPTATTAQPTTTAANGQMAAVERGRIAALGGLTALIWLVILVLMVWQS